MTQSCLLNFNINYPPNHDIPTGTKLHLSLNNVDFHLMPFRNLRAIFIEGLDKNSQKRGSTERKQGQGKGAAYEEVRESPKPPRHPS